MSNALSPGFNKIISQGSLLERSKLTLLNHISTELELECLSLHRLFPSRVESVEELKLERCPLRCLSSLTTADLLDQSGPGPRQRPCAICSVGYCVELSPW